LTGKKDGVPPPNYTQTPNPLFDEHLPHMGLAEMKVVFMVCRKTFGFHKREDELSLSQLQELTGLSRQGVIDGGQAGIDRGILKRRKSGRSYAYSLIVKPVDQSKKEESNRLTKDSQASRPKIVKPVDTQKKLLNKDTKEKELGAPAPSPSPSEKITNPLEGSKTSRDVKNVTREVWEKLTKEQRHDLMKQAYLLGFHQLDYLALKEQGEEIAPSIWGKVETYSKFFREEFDALPSEVIEFYQWFAQHFPEAALPDKHETIKGQWANYQAAKLAHKNGGGSKLTTKPAQSLPRVELSEEEIAERDELLRQSKARLSRV
jgi:hypothetical protein